MIHWVILALCLACGSQALDKTRIEMKPPPMSGFNVNAWVGHWYYVFRSPPCSWQGANEMTDYEGFSVIKSPNLILTKETWRNELCNTLNTHVYITGPGEFVVKDPLGNSFSGVTVVPYTDYKTCTITWGCTKFSARGKKCMDPWINVKTRNTKLKPKTIAKINFHLHRLWGITVEQLETVKRAQRCPKVGGLGPFIGGGPSRGHGHGHSAPWMKSKF